MFIIEDYPLENPHYHTVGDTLDTINTTFHHEATQALVAGAAHLAATQPW